MATTSKTAVPVPSGNILGRKLDTVLRLLRDRHMRHYRDSYFHFWADLLLAGILAGLFILLVWLLLWQPRPEFSLESSLSSARVISGQAEEFKASFRNGEDGTISATVISFDLPDRFRVTAATPAEAYDAASASFRLGDLPKGARGEVSITGVIVGTPGERQALGLRAEYQYGRIQKELLDSLAYTIDGSALELGFEVPERAYVDSNFSGILTVANAGAAADNVELVIPSSEWTVDFDEQKNGGNAFIIQSLTAGETRRVPFTARIAKTGSFELTAESNIRPAGQTLFQSRVTRSVEVVKPSLAVTADISNRSLSATQSSAQLSLVVANNDERPLENISLTASAIGSGVLVSGISTSTDGVLARGSSLQLTSPLPAGATMKILATAQLHREHVETSDSARINIIASYRLEGQSYEYTVSAGSVRFNSNLSVSSAGYYYGPQGDQLGVGPVPPRVDIPTTYWIIWQVNNLGNDIKDMEVTADLPAAVAWPDQKSVTSGDVTYSPVSRRVLWRPGAVGQGGGNYRVSFAITLVPRPSDFGKVPTLLENIRFKGVDVFTGATLSRDLPQITANIEADRLSAGKGTVQETE